MIKFTENGNISETEDFKLITLQKKPSLLFTALFKSAAKYRCFIRKNKCLVPNFFLRHPVYFQRILVENGFSHENTKCLKNELFFTFYSELSLKLYNQ